MAADRKGRKARDSEEAFDGVRDRALQRLAETGAYGLVTEAGGLAVYVARNNFNRPIMIVDQAGRLQLMREELLRRSGRRADEWLISDLGRARLMRTKAADSPFRSQHQSLEIREMREPNGAAAMVRVNQAESPLAWLASHTDRQGRPMIGEAQFMAGERLRRDFTLANLQPSVTAMWGMPINSAGRRGGADTGSLNDTMIAAKERVWRAVDAVGPDLGAILLQVCCHLNGLAQAERHLGWPARAGKVVLRIALDRLAAHYGIGGALTAGRGPESPGSNGKNSRIK
jgi:Domain of unknown function (DUF6456)